MRQPTVISVLLAALATAASFLRPADNSTLQGFTAESLERLKEEMHRYSAGTKPIVTLLARNGEIIYHDAYGKDKTKPVSKDSIFNLMSMTKPISGVAMMTFFEEGKFGLDDLVSKHIPEFANLKVGIAPQKTPMTMKQLMSHSAGFAADAAARGKTLDEGVAILKDEKKTQLAFQPGTSWKYGPGVEIQGYLMQKWAGKDIAEIYDERLLKPLGMVDTAFWTPAEKQSRVISSPFGGAPTKKPTRLIPSYGLHSTAEDYWKFCQMILNGGEFKGKRYLQPETVKLMQKNVLDWDNGVYVNFMGGGPGVGFGLDFAVVMDPKKQQKVENMPKGSFFWGGAFGTWFWIDPANNVTFVGLVNQAGGLSGDSTLRQASARALYTGLSR
ncbi:beta-lactamase/transpeptidase-like protein [Venturia nashicola]|uniref:Beta-lactamase/transpeptidase-like protein n=1 Tax=Venturia nashicola TaxID=86259 RepID=A0A4Z1P2E6_9PEZI|nr:beta-lactamase/transpeptidase-like protein [Venturia nashicola]TLD32150.1 beta-lactamase/transpeptidase-like protein [Venturia nashicola]